MKITAAIIAYNEEQRIENTLRSVLWCDQILVVDKHSTDRTREISLRYTPHVYEIPYSEYDVQDHQRILDRVDCEWVFYLTASDIIHPGLAAQIRALLDQEDFPFDVIHVPFRRYVLGLETKYSPWYSALAPHVFRKRVMKVTNDVHEARILDTERHYRLPNSDLNCMYHLTHETVDRMMDRHLMYCRAEARLFPDNKTLGQAFRGVLGSLKHVFINRRSFLLGWDGISLGLAYISYYLLRFIYIWENRRAGKSQSTYEKIRTEILDAWENAKLARIQIKNDKQ